MEQECSGDGREPLCLPVNLPQKPLDRLHLDFVEVRFSALAADPSWNSI
jgi:hypothetical protein